MIWKLEKDMKSFNKGLGIPFKDLPDPGNPFEDEIDEHSAFFKNLMGLKMKDMMMSVEERTSPDTFGCDNGDNIKKIFQDIFKML